jgi:hypothetical protein
MSATPDNTLANPELIADLQRQLTEYRAERNETQRQLAERTIERDEALAQQIATAEVLQVINSSPGNLAPIFDTILEKALQVCSATFGLLTSYDNGRLTRVADRGLPAAYKNWCLEHPLPEMPSVGYPPPLRRALSGEAVVHEPDMMASEAYRQGIPARLALVDLAGSRS